MFETSDVSNVASKFSNYIFERLGNFVAQSMQKIHVIVSQELVKNNWGNLVHFGHFDKILLYITQGWI